jgi:hypothetical protein
MEATEVRNEKIRNEKEETYECVRDYDPVLRSHCRIRSEERAEAGSDVRSIGPAA